MLRHRLIVAAKALAGLLVGLAIWWGLGGPYDDVLAALSEPIVRVVEPAPMTRLVARNGEIVINRIDFPPRGPRPALEASYLTANIILLTALFATNSRPLSVKNVSALVFAALLLVPIHIFAVVVNVQTIYAWELGAWSEAHYGRVARTLWEGATHFYTVAGSFGSVFLLWCLRSKT